MGRLEGEAASISLATEEQFAQYQQLKQVTATTTCAKCLRTLLAAATVRDSTPLGASAGSLHHPGIHWRCVQTFCLPVCLHPCVCVCVCACTASIEDSTNKWQLRLKIHKRDIDTQQSIDSKAALRFCRILHGMKQSC